MMTIVINVLWEGNTYENQTASCESQRVGFESGY